MLNRITEQCIECAVDSMLTRRYKRTTARPCRYGERGDTMSVSLPNNKLQKKIRYWQLVSQSSLTLAQAKQAYRDYLKRLK